MRRAHKGPVQSPCGVTSDPGRAGIATTWPTGGTRHRGMASPKALRGPWSRVAKAPGESGQVGANASHNSAFGPLGASARKASTTVSEAADGTRGRPQVAKAEGGGIGKPTLKDEGRSTAL